ncbi:MAG: signal peptidase I [Bacteroidales bacterium]
MGKITTKTVIEDIKKRLSEVKRSSWITFTIVSIIFLLWVIWLGSWWVLIFELLIADMYLTQYIPWTWWKGAKNKYVRSVMAWVDAIIYALVLAYLLFTYVGQNYQIPTSSLEKSLLVGDYLWVNKAVYGPRVPMTPLHFPLAQHTMPIIGGNSYIEYPQWDYKRLKGLRNIERNDIVVFNFPAGDTVTTKVQNPDYYTLISQYGREAINRNERVFGEVIYRPVDRRENYVKRAIGLPGETLQIVDNIVYIDGEPIREPEMVQYNYLIQTNGAAISDMLWESADVSMDDRVRVSIEPNDVERLGLEINENGGINPIYQAPLTEHAVETLRANPAIAQVVKIPTYEVMNVYPITHNYGWTRADYGAVWIPKKGETVELTLENLPVYERPIKNYEGNTLEVVGGEILINGVPSNSYTFKMDYYFMMGDNRDNSADSRYWGFVPEDHVVGTPIFVFLSVNKDKSLFNGGIRWNRIFMSAESNKGE